MFRNCYTSINAHGMSFHLKNEGYEVADKVIYLVIYNILL